MKLFSIVTINYNNVDGLKNTIDSVIDQTFTDYEHIIIDGGSTDTSVDVIKKNASNFTYWVSEKDKGIYNAQNKGIEKSTGKYLIFLNSGDFFNDKKVLEDLSVYCNQADLIYGDIKFKSETQEQISCYPNLIDFNFFLNNTLPHPCTAIKRSLFDTFGLYKEHIKISADWAFFIDVICKGNVSYLHIDRVISVFLTGGLSTDVVAVEKEKRSYLELNYPAYYKCFSELLIENEKAKYLKSSKPESGLFKFLSKIYHKIFGKIKRTIKHIFKKEVKKEKSQYETISEFSNVDIHATNGISLDATFVVRADAKRLFIGEGVGCRKYCSFLVYPNAELIIHGGVSFNNYCSINCLGKIEIGENTLFGEAVKLYDHNHKYEYKGKELVVSKDKFNIGKIKIGKNCWIGSNVTILNNVEIGDNVIIGANCLIFKSIPSNSVVKNATHLTVNTL